MKLKSVSIINEGPLDFVKGATIATGQKINQSSLVKGTKDVINAGIQASAAANLSNAVTKLATIIQGRSTDTTVNSSQPAEVTDYTQKTPNQFANTSKPRMKMGAHGPEHVFSSYLQQCDASFLNEGMWDFIKGAGSVIKTAAQDKIDKLANQPSVLKDIYQAGKQSSAQATTNKITTNVAGLVRQIQQLSQQAGQASNQVISKALLKFPNNIQQQVLGLLS